MATSSTNLLFRWGFSAWNDEKHIPCYKQKMHKHGAELLPIRQTTPNNQSIITIVVYKRTKKLVSRKYTRRFK